MLANVLNPAVTLTVLAIITLALCRGSVRIVDKTIMLGHPTLLTEMDVQLFRAGVLTTIPAFVLFPFTLACIIASAAAAIITAPFIYCLTTHRWRGLDLKVFVPILNEVAVESMRRCGDDGEYLITTKALKNAFARRRLDTTTKLSLLKILHRHFLSIGYLQRQSIVAAAYINTNDALPPLKANYIYCVEHRHFKRSFAW